MINKRGNLLAIISIMGSVLLVMAFVFMFVLGGGILSDTIGQAFTEVRTIGNITENVNVTTYANIAFAPVETILSNFSLYAAVLYILGIVLVFTLAFVFRGNVSGPVMALFVISALLIITFSIVLSNTYEDFYHDDTIGPMLASYTLASWLIIYSPTILTIVIFLAGIILMTGKEQPYG